MIHRLSLPVQLALVILFVLLFGTMMSASTVTFFYTISVLFKEFLSFLLPFIVFSFVLSGILAFKRNAPVMLAVMLAMIFCSNAVAALLSYALMRALLPVLTCDVGGIAMVPTAEIVPYIQFALPKLLRSETSLIAAVIVGLLFSYVQLPEVDRFAARARRLVERILSYVIIPVLPLYVLGFLLKVRYEGAFSLLVKNYGATVGVIVALQLLYLGWMYLVATGFSIHRAGEAIRNAMPSYITAFSTMSSAATVPVTIVSAERNNVSRTLAHVAIPIMANVHLLGDCIGIPILAMTTLVLFKGCMVPFVAYCLFVCYFCTSMFAVSGIPGGTIIVITPLLVSQFGYTSEMIGVITTLYILMDSFGTAGNVMGDGALVMMLQKALNRLGIR